MLVQADHKSDKVLLVKAAMGIEALSTAAIEECLKRCFGDKLVTFKEQNSSDTVKIKVKLTESQYFVKEPRDLSLYQERLVLSAH